MLKLSLCPGQYIDIGENIRVVFAGGSANNIRLLIDAPREISITRSNAGEGKGKPDQYYTEKGISESAQREIVDILKREKLINSSKHEPANKSRTHTKGNVYTLHNS